VTHRVSFLVGSCILMMLIAASVSAQTRAIGTSVVFTVVGDPVDDALLKRVRSQIEETFGCAVRMAGGNDLAVRPDPQTQDQ
jgi:hypothetical protein